MKFRTGTNLVMVGASALLCVAPMPAFGQLPSNAVKPQPRSKVEAPAGHIPRLPDGHPNLNGFYASSSGPDTPVNAPFGPRDPNYKRGYNYAKERQSDPNQPPYKPELMDKVKHLAEFESKFDPAFYSKPGGVPRVGPPHAIVQAPGMPIVFLYQVASGNTFRIVPMDGRPHVVDTDSSYYGDSIGHWDGDTLVVDTTAFNDDTWIGIDVWFHSTALHVADRIDRIDGAIRYQATLEDPNVFTRPWTMNPRVAKAADELIVENPPCHDEDESHVTGFSEKTKVQ